MQTDPRIAQEVAESRAQVVAQVLGRPVTRGELADAFDRVANPQGWKLAIDATVLLTTDRELLTLREAVVFFTGSVPTIDAIGDYRYRVQAAGYYAAVGA